MPFIRGSQAAFKAKFDLVYLDNGIGAAALYSNQMALITSVSGILRSLSTKWP